MVQTTARIKQAGKQFEMLIDLDDALQFKRGERSSIDIEGDKIFTDLKKGNVASNSDLEKFFGTIDISLIAAKIIKDGEILVTKEHRDEEREKKVRQIIEFLVTNAVDPKTGTPHSSERIKNAIEQSHVSIKNTSIENQIKDILQEVSKIIPIKLETKKVKITIPAIYTGKAYGVINQYKEQEKWLSDGGLEVIVEIPAGILINFYDKLNSVTHGSALTEEING
jgi:ribosome maturation protein SDO1